MVTSAPWHTQIAKLVALPRHKSTLPPWMVTNVKNASGDGVRIASHVALVDGPNVGQSRFTPQAFSDVHIPTITSGRLTQTLIQQPDANLESTCVLKCYKATTSEC